MLFISISVDLYHCLQSQVLSDFGIRVCLKTDNNNIHVDIYEKIRTTERAQHNCDNCGCHVTKMNQYCKSIVFVTSRLVRGGKHCSPEGNIHYYLT